MRTLSSRDNAHIKRLHELARSARARRMHRLTLLDGAHLVSAALERGWPMRELLVSDEGLNTPEILRLLESAGGVPITHVSGSTFAHVSPVDTPSGILALIDYPTEHAASPAAGRSILILEAVQDPGNLGSILRTAAAAGVRDVFLTESSTQAWSPRALRAGMGGHFELCIREGLAVSEGLEGSSIAAVLDAFAGTVIATALGAESQSLFALDLRTPVAWLFGAEGAGLSQALARRAEVRVCIPMPGRVESLNVGAAVAVCLFEQLRQSAYSAR